MINRAFYHLLILSFLHIVMSNVQLLTNDIDLSSASFVNVLNSKGEKITFGSIFENQKTIVVFIRECIF